MRKRLAGIIAAIAMVATVASSSGCVWIMADEPKALNTFND